MLTTFSQNNPHASRRSVTRAKRWVVATSQPLASQTGRDMLAQGLVTPRCQWMSGRRIGMEHDFPAHLAREMAARGHDIHLAHDDTGFGRGQDAIRDSETGIYCGSHAPGTDFSIAVL